MKTRRACQRRGDTQGQTASTPFNFIRGMGSVIDLMPRQQSTRVGRGIDLNRSVAEALGSDWDRVAKDFRGAFEKVVAKEMKR